MDKNKLSGLWDWTISFFFRPKKLEIDQTIGWPKRLTKTTCENLAEFLRANVWTEFNWTKCFSVKTKSSVNQGVGYLGSYCLNIYTVPWLFLFSIEIPFLIKRPRQALEPYQAQTWIKLCLDIVAILNVRKPKII